MENGITTNQLLVALLEISGPISFNQHELERIQGLQLNICYEVQSAGGDSVTTFWAALPDSAPALRLADEKAE